MTKEIMMRHVILLIVFLFFTHNVAYAGNVPLSIDENGVVKAPKLCMKRGYFDAYIDAGKRDNGYKVVPIEGKWEFCALTKVFMQMKGANNDNKAGCHVHSPSPPGNWSLSAQGVSLHQELRCKARCFSFACD